MTKLRLTLAIAVITLLSLVLYLSVALPLLQQQPGADILPAPGASATGARPPGSSATGPAKKPAAPADPAAASATAAGASGTRLIEFFGRITDPRGQPIEDVLVTEERYFFTGRSDAGGHYRILLELPRQRLPILKFLRAGYAGKRLQLTQSLLRDDPVYALDVVLEESDDTLRVSGSVANDLGVALEGVRIDISALESDEEHNFFLTVFSDARGNFVLEGVRAATRYRLTAMLAPDYPVYSDPAFDVGSESMQLDIVLQSLRFVNLGGMILNPAAAPVTNFEFYIDNVSTGLHKRKIVSDSSGYFTLEQFPLGEVSLSTRGAEFYRLTGLRLTEDNYSSLELIVDRGDRYLSGWVSDANDVALEKAMVTLDAVLIDGAVESYSYRSQTTDSSGRFGFDNLAASSYRLSVYATGFDKLETSYRLQSQSQQLHLRLARQD